MYQNPTQHVYQSPSPLTNEHSSPPVNYQSEWDRFVKINKSKTLTEFAEYMSNVDHFDMLKNPTEHHMSKLLSTPIIKAYYVPAETLLEQQQQQQHTERSNIVNFLLAIAWLMPPIEAQHYFLPMFFLVMQAKFSSLHFPQQTNAEKYQLFDSICKKLYGSDNNEDFFFN